TVEDQTYLLEAGDSITFPSNLPHRMRNPGQKPSKTLWVITPGHGFQLKDDHGF
ncbi:MAG: cupin domain-containing protein, partial [Deltaproteobacteria bacterium]|nr:cupin domain-containing protein [Deltaproteobacteria bacterium]